MNKLLIYIPELNNRTKFIFDFLFKDLLKLDIQYITDKAGFLTDKSTPRISYSFIQIDAELNITPHGLLSEKGVDQQFIKKSELDGMPIFFQVNNEGCPFDPFAASFFFITRFEEYWPFRKDHIGRFPANESILYEHGVLNKPLIDIYAQFILDKLQEYYPGQFEDKRVYSVLPTIDIDNAYAYLGKGLVRTLGALVRSAITLNTVDLRRRTSTLAGLEKDPYEVYDDLLATCRKYDLRALFFVLLADYGLNDKNVSYTSRKFQSLIKHLQDFADVAIHPGYAASENGDKLRKEQARLSSILNRPILASRQHFLKISLPKYYRRLIESEILHDYSMGYPDEPGFRAATCTPFPFFDLELNQKTALTIHPFSVMEGCFRYYKSMSPEEALESISGVISEVKKVKGQFCFLWHNDSLSEHGDWKGWSGLFEQTLDKARE